MKTAKEFMEKLQSDEAFAAQLKDKAAGAEDKLSAICDAAKELGYEISPEELKEISAQSEDISEEEIGKISGGTGVSYQEMFSWVTGLFD